jgi:trigger factor
MADALDLGSSRETCESSSLSFRIYNTNNSNLKKFYGFEECMQITIENLLGLERKLNIVIPAERVDKDFQAKLRELAATIKLPGFRPGKVPFAMIQQRYSGSVRADVLDNLIREMYVAALKQEKLNPVSMPKIEIVSAKSGEPFSFTAVFEVYPEIKAIKLEGMQVEKIISKVDPSDVEETIEKLRKKQAQWQEITEADYKSQTGNQLTVDFEVKLVDDPSAKINKEKNIKFILGDGSMWPDFEKHLYGMHVNEKKKYNLQFPEVHTDEKLAGKMAEFTVELHKICEPILPSLDDDFSKKFGITGGLEAMKTEIQKNMELELQKNINNMFKQALLRKLLESNPIEVPKILIENQLDRMAQRWDKKSSEFPRKDFTKQAQDMVALTLLLAAIAEKNKIIVEPKELQNKVEKLASMYSDTAKAIDWFFSDDKRLTEIRAALLEDKIVDYVASNVDIIEKEKTYKEIVK